MKLATYSDGIIAVVYFRRCNDCGMALCQFIRMACWRGGGYKLRNFRGPGRWYCKPPRDDIPF